MVVENIRETADKPPAVSIMVAVYNGEPWLARCLDSLLGQSIKNIEIICIDDKSTDSSLEFLKKYAKKDNRIKIIAKEKNEGYTDSHNIGLAVAAGEYIGFLDQDDFVDSNFFEKLYDRAKSNDADIVKGEVREITCDGKERHFGPSFSNIRKNKGYFLTTFWSAIYKHDFLKQNKLCFPVDVTISADDVFLVKAVILANKIELVEDVCYYYVRREDSLYSNNLSVEKLKSSIKSKNMIIDFINDKLTDNKETYNLVFEINFKWLFYSEFGKSQTIDGCLTVIRGAIELYKKCKYKDDLGKTLGENLINFLSEEDEVALLTDLPGRTEKVSYFKLFNAITLLKIIYKHDITTVILLRYIPLLKINKKHDGDYYYLFFCLPVMRKTTKNS